MAVLRGGCGSDETEPVALFMPIDRHAGVGHQLVGSEVCRLAAMKDRPGDVGANRPEPRCGIP